MRADRRQFLGGAAVAVLAAGAGFRVRAQTSAISGVPVARVEPVTETFFGQSVTDPYRWMENPADADWEPYMRANADHARAVFDAIPGRQALYEQIAAVSGGTAAARKPTPVGDKLFYQWREVGAETQALRLYDGTTTRTLIDTNGMTGESGAHISLDWWHPSPDGAWVVYGLSEAGSETSTLHVMNVQSGEILPERIGGTNLGAVFWLPDSSGFLYNRLSGAASGSIEYYMDSACWLHVLRADPADDVQVLKRGQYADIPAEPYDFPIVIADPTSDHVIALMVGGVRRENPAWSARLSDLVAGAPQWRRIADISDEVIVFAARGDDIWLLTTKDAENGKVLHTSLSNPDLAAAEVVMPEGEAVVENIFATSDALYAVIMDGGYHRLDRIGADGQGAPVALPYEGSILETGYSATSPDLYLTMSSWLEPVGIYRREASGALIDTGLSPRPDIDTSGYELIRDFATARDGTRVPLSIVARRGLARDGSAPAMVEAYGAYQIVNSPGFDVRGLALLEKGGVQAVAHVRGGGEYGRRWWQAGRKLTKPNTWRDLIDCCEHLIAEGWTSSAKLGIVGGSAGGITMGRALTERPDLFTLVVPQVGCLNPLRMEFSQNGPTNIEEFGTVTDEDGFRGLYAMDSTQHVTPGTTYPAVILTHGMTDPRVEPWQSAKMTAHLRAAASPGSGPVLLRVDFEAGHGLGSTRSQFDNERADIYAFFLQRTGHPDFQAR